ncbi:universal stress protein [Paraburkholderia sp.]
MQCSGRPVDAGQTRQRRAAHARRSRLRSQGNRNAVIQISIPHLFVAHDERTPFPSTRSDMYRHILADNALARMKRDSVQGAPQVIETNLVDGDYDVAHCILHAPADLKADLVVMGTHGRRGVRRLVLGSVAERFLRMAQCPVLMISAHGTPEVATDTVGTVEREKKST